ncbi:serine/threonine-protein kinase haspin, partial [Phenoliferia sp. Uapishka_3]
MMLGGSTKTYKAYGKRKTHTINRTSLWPSSPDTSTSTSKQSTSSHSTSDSDASDSDDQNEDIFAFPSQSRSTALTALKTKRVARSVIPKSSNNNKSDQENRAPPPVRKAPYIQIKTYSVSSPVKKATTRTSRGGLGVGLTSAPAAGGENRSRSPLKPKLTGTRAGIPMVVLSSEEEEPVRLGRVKGERETSKTKLLPATKTRRTPRIPVLKESSEDVELDDGRDAKVDTGGTGRRTRGTLLTTAPPIVVDLTQSDDDENDTPPRISPQDEEEEVDQLESDSGDSEVDELDSDLDSPPTSHLPNSHFHSPISSPSPLEYLLSLSSPHPYHPLPFDQFISHPPAPFASSPLWAKIGEASYSEVFEGVSCKGEKLVCKIIPVHVEGGEGGDEMPYASEVEAVVREIAMGKLLGGEESKVDGFVKFKGAFIVQGCYPTPLLSQWDRFRSSHPRSTEQIRPDVLPADQIYAIIVLENAGIDLESFKVKKWEDAASIMEQVARICKGAEEELEFEHRDLHWGNILVRPSANDDDELAERMKELDVGLRASTSRRADPPPTSAKSGSGVTVTLIDFTLSRARVQGGGGKDKILFDAFEDECVFEGEGDAQFDVYRDMRQRTGGDWETFCPATNLLVRRPFHPALSLRMFGLTTILSAVSAVTTFFALDQSLGNLISSSASTVYRITRASTKVDDGHAAVSSFFDVQSPSRSQPTTGSRPRRSRRSAHLSSESATASSVPKIVVDTFYLAPLSSDHLETLSPPPRVANWAQNFPASATQLHPSYFEELLEIETILRKRAARKEKKERARV